MTQEIPLRGKYGQSVGALPDALAFVTPDAARVWILLDRSGPLTAARIEEVRDVSQATVYRRLRELQDADLVKKGADINNPKSDQYTAIRPGGGEK